MRKCDNATMEYWNNALPFGASVMNGGNDFVLQYENTTIIITFAGMYRKIAGFLLLVVLYGCSKESIGRFFMKKMKPRYSFTLDKAPEKPDYADSASWLVFEEDSMDVDIFYLHPTTYLKRDNWNQDIADTATNNFTMRNPVIRSQLSVFRGLGNFYAPHFRQATIYSFMDVKDNGEQALDLAYSDVERSFFYYLEHFNKGKPFIIEAHSQGAMHTMRLLKKLYADESIRTKIIAVYAIGWPVTENYLKENPEVRLCEDSSQTGCLVGWLTEGERPVYTMVKEPAKAVNPLTWKTDSVLASAQLNKGAILFFDDRMDTVMNYVSARVENGVVRVSKPPRRRKLYTPFMRGNYHMYDYSFFFNNIRENAQHRIDNYLN